MLIPPEVFPISRMCDNEAARYVLTAVHLERTPDGKPVAVSCDGRRLIAVQWQEDKPEEYPKGLDATPVADFATLIPRKQWDEAAKLPLKKCPKRILTNMVVEESTANGKITLGATDLETERRITATVPEGKYVQWRNCIPERKPYEEVVVRIDSQALAETLATLKTLTDDDYHRVALHVPFDPTAPFTIKAIRDGHIETTAVVMPLTPEKRESDKRLEHRANTIDSLDTALGADVPSQYRQWLYGLMTNEQLDQWLAILQQNREKAHEPQGETCQTN